MFAALGYTVLRLIRVQIGPLLLGDLPSAQWRMVAPEELQALQKMRVESMSRK